MSLYVLMRVFESAPERYDLGIRLLTLGRLDRSYDRLISRVHAGDRVLDIGCGTGALSLLAAARGARVDGFDVNPGMLAIASRRIERAQLKDFVTLTERGVAELDAEPDESRDVVTAGLCLSELTDDEVRFTLEQGRRILRPGGLLLVADETLPESPLLRILHHVLRAPLVLVAWLLTQQTTHPVAGLAARAGAAGFDVESVRSGQFGGFVELVARKPEDTPGAGAA